MACLVYLSKDLEIKRKFSHVLKTVNPRERILRPNLSAWDGAPAGERVGQPNLGNLGFQEGPKGVGGGGPGSLASGVHNPRLASVALDKFWHQHTPPFSSRRLSCELRHR